MLAERLSDGERQTLMTLEGTIKTQVQSFVEVGTALLKIRDERLYREKAETFEGYCQTEWGFTRRRAGQLIEAAAVVQALPEPAPAPAEKSNDPDLQTGTKVPKTGTVANERVAREVAKAPPEKRAEVVQKAAETAPKDKEGKPKITAAHVRRVVEKEAAPDQAPAETPAVKVPEWQAVAADVDGLITDLRAVTRRMRAVFKVEGQTIGRPAANRYTWSGTVGAVNELVRYLDDNKPAGQDRGGIITAADEKKQAALAGGRKSA
jgi:hypothetical protein